MGTVSQALELFDRETETFRHFKKMGKDDEPGSVTCITEDKDGRIWITSGKELMVLTEHSHPKTKASLFTLRKINDNGSATVLIKMIRVLSA